VVVKFAGLARATTGQALIARLRGTADPTTPAAAGARTPQRMEEFEEEVRSAVYCFFSEGSNSWSVQSHRTGRKTMAISMMSRGLMRRCSERSWGTESQNRVQ
jgi:hypothetical protein